MYFTVNSGSTFDKYLIESVRNFLMFNITHRDTRALIKILLKQNALSEWKIFSLLYIFVHEVSITISFSLSTSYNPETIDATIFFWKKEEKHKA